MFDTDLGYFLMFGTDLCCFLMFGTESRKEAGRGKQIGVVMAMLVRLMGWAPSLAGLVVAAGLIPASGFIGRRLGKIRRSLVSLTDARVRMTREV